MKIRIRLRVMVGQLFQWLIAKIRNEYSKERLAVLGEIMLSTGISVNSGGIIYLIEGKNWSLIVSIFVFGFTLLIVGIVARNKSRGENEL